MSQQPPSVSRPPHYLGFMITLIHTTLGRIPLDEWSARRRDLYLTIHNTHKRQTSMPPAGFEPAIPASQRPHKHTLNHAATRIGLTTSSVTQIIQSVPSLNLSLQGFIQTAAPINVTSGRFQLLSKCICSNWIVNMELGWNDTEREECKFYKKTQSKWQPTRYPT